MEEDTGPANTECGLWSYETSPWTLSLSTPLSTTACLKTLARSLVERATWRSKNSALTTLTLENADFDPPPHAYNYAACHLLRLQMAIDYDTKNNNVQTTTLVVICYVCRPYFVTRNNRVAGRWVSEHWIARLVFRSLIQQLCEIAPHIALAANAALSYWSESFSENQRRLERAFFWRHATWTHIATDFKTNT